MGVEGFDQALTAGTSKAAHSKGVPCTGAKHLADVGGPLVFEQHALLVDPVLRFQQDDVHGRSAADVFGPELRLLLLHGAHQLLAAWIIEAVHLDAGLLEPGLSP